MTQGHTERLEAALDGKYHIERKLGEGGMASVYLAEDIKHRRKVALKILGVKTSRELAEIIVAVGLAQNLAALRALATEGIQRGHMSLHARQVAIAAGAAGDQIERVATQLVQERAVRLDRAEAILNQQVSESIG